MANSKLVKAPENITTVVGTKSVSMTCSTNGSDPVNWKWKRNSNYSAFQSIFIGGTVGNLYKHKYAVTQTTTYTLTVVDVEYTDAGTFKCIDKGGQGPEEMDAELIVLGEC